MIPQSQITVVITTGPLSARFPTAEDLIATVDFGQLLAGRHKLPISVQLSSENPEVTFNLTRLR